MLTLQSRTYLDAGTVQTLRILITISLHVHLHQHKKANLNEEDLRLLAHD